MAGSPAHRWGQIIGDLLEDSVEPLLADFALKHDLYLDKRGHRPARKTVDVVWADSFGNKHKLDYVLERGGTATRIGTPVAFIEIAWRRYTKHSKNKAQEIQGAIEPLITMHREAAPFFGAVLAGVFTNNALSQLSSLGCTILYFPYQTVLTAFQQVGIDASSEEETPDELFAEKVRAWDGLPQGRKAAVAKALLELNSKQVEQFIEVLKIVATRQLESVYVLILRGAAFEFASVDDATTFIEDYQAHNSLSPIVRYEIHIRYSNGQSIRGEYPDKVSALQFLRGYQPPAIQPAEDETESAEAAQLSPSDEEL